MSSEIDADNNFYMDKTWKDCEQCSKAHSHEQLRLDEDHAFHCVICHRCSLSDADFSSFETVRAVSELNAGFSYCVMVNKIVQKLPGSFHWICSSCQAGPKKNVFCENNIDVLTKLVNELTSVVQSKFDSLDNKFQTVSDEVKACQTRTGEVLKLVSEINENDVECLGFQSPPRKRKINMNAANKSSYSEALNTPFDSMSSQNVTKKDIKKKVSSTKVKMNVVSSKSNTVLKTLNMNSSDFPSFSAKHKANGSMDFIFDSIAKAEKAKSSLESKLDNVHLDDFSLTGMTKWNVVGLPYSVTVEEALMSLVTCNNSLGFTSLESANFENCITAKHVDGSILKLIDVRRCRNGQYRLVISTNDLMTDLIKNKTLKVMNVICRKYEFSSHDRCYKCHHRGHFAAQCKNETICAFCAGTHETGSIVCTATTPSCINCINAKLEKVDHAVYSNFCPFNKIQ